MKIVVDADACPVKREICDVALERGVPVWMVSTYAHELHDLPGATVVRVDRSPQAVDLYIANHLSAGDVLVTGDYGLAALGLLKRAHPLSPRGMLFTDERIERLLAERHEAAKRRRAGYRTKGPRSYTAKDRATFLHRLTKLLTDLQENGDA